MISNKITLKVPSNVRYLKEWEGFVIPYEKCIIDKKITGCGFTEFCLCNPVPTILCSPRIKLLENKFEKHPEAFYYKEISGESAEGFTKETKLDFSKLSERLMEYIGSHEVPKILTTYDSFKWILKVLKDNNIEDRFQVIVDEFQAILGDAGFRGKTCYEFLNITSSCPRVCYVSATPLLDEYLYRVPQLQFMNYYEFDWGDRLRKADIQKQPMNSIDSKFKEIVEGYRKNGYFDRMIDGDGNVIAYSNEAVFFINDVKKVRDVIKKNSLKLSECNILMADSEENRKKIREAFGYSKTSKKNDKTIFGGFRIPQKGEEHKTFTFCTKTVYYGTDFYSTNASTYIFSDGNIESLANDPIEDIEQIIGRQRLDENPWKGKAIVFIISTRNPDTETEYLKAIEEKKRITEIRKREWNALSKESISDGMLNDLTDYLDYIDGKFTVNTLYVLQEERVLRLQNIDYADRFNILSDSRHISNPHLQKFINDFKQLATIPEKLRYVCEFDFRDKDEYKFAFNFMKDLDKKNWYIINVYIKLGRDYIMKAGYDTDFRFSLEYYDKTHNVKSELSSVIIIGKRYTRKELKNILQKVYDEVLDLPKTAKATDINQYYKVERRRIKQQEAYEIIEERDC